MASVRRSYVLPAALVATILCVFAAVHFRHEIVALIPTGDTSVASVSRSAMRMPFIQRADGSFVAQTFAGKVRADEGGIHYNLHKSGSGAGTVSFKESLVGAADLTMEGQGKGQTTVNVYRGNDPSQWQQGLDSYNSIDFTQPWDGVDLSLVAHGDNVEKVFTVEPGTDPSAISIAVEGATSLSVTGKDELHVVTANGEMSMSAPIAYQEIDGEKKPVQVAYEVRGNEYGFSLGAYDTTKDLVIDPVIASTYFGGRSYESGEGSNQDGVAVDGEGNIYLYGVTASSDLPVTDGSDLDGDAGFDVFVAKFSPGLDVLQAATYIGGTWYENTGDIAVSNSGYTYITGQTSSPDFPTNGGSAYSFGGSNDAFIAALDGSLELVAGTYYGGSSYDGATAIDLATAVEGEEIYIGGNTRSGVEGDGAHMLPMEGSPHSSSTDASDGGLNDGFVAGFYFNGSSFSLDFSTFLDLTEAYVTDLKVSELDGTLFVSGYTNNSGMTHMLGYTANYDGFVGRLPLDLSDLVGAYVGGTSNDWATGLALEESTGLDAVYVVGDTRSTDFPVTDDSTLLTADDYGHDVYIAKLDADVEGIEAATYLNSYGNDYDARVALDQGDVFVGAYSDAYNYYSETYSPVTEGALSANGYEKVMLARYDGDLNQEAVTYYGGRDSNHFGDIAFNSFHQIVVAGITWAYQTFPVNLDSFQPFHAADDGASDAFVSVLSRDLLAECGDGFQSFLDSGEGGYVSGEECDDGNTANGDGCSSTCHVENGYTCDYGYSPSLCYTTNCAPDATSSYVFDGHCYAGYEETLTWSDAQVACNENGGKLTSVTNMQEARIMDRIWQTSSGNLWFGLNDLGEEGYFAWDGGEDVEYTNWASLQPNNTSDNNCGRSRWGGLWSFEDCTETAQYACEYDSTECGDGMLFGGEECDDGNTDSGDGCSASCQVEEGFSCSGLPSVCEEYCNPNADDGDAFTAVGSKCFVAFNDTVSWDDAQESCDGLGGDLAAIQNDDENEAAASFSYDFGVNVWLGGTDVAEEGTFVWVNGAGTFWNADIQPADYGEGVIDETDGAIDGVYASFGPGEPNDYNDTDVGSYEHCVESNSAGNWNDNYCGVLRGYVCQLENTLYEGSSSSSSSSSSEEESSAPSQGGGGGRRGGGVARLTNAQMMNQESGHPAAEGQSSSNGRGEPVTVVSQVFKDVYTKDWFSAYVRKVVEKRIFTGYKDQRGKSLGLYGPADPITMGQLAKVAAVIADKNVTEKVGADWAAPYLDAAKKDKLTAFLEALDQNKKATRGAVIQTILEALGIPTDTGDASFPDVPASHPYAKAIAAAKKLGIVAGDDGTGNFRPNDPVNRAEVAKMIVLALQAH